MRANDPTNKIFYKGKSDDFIVFVNDAATLQNWKNDSSIPLAEVVNGWKIFVTHKYVSSTLTHSARSTLQGQEKRSEGE